MRVAMIGASATSLATARLMAGRGHDVVIVDTNIDRINALADSIDCGFIHGDGTKPAILREIGPRETAMLFCLTDDDQANMLAGLVGRSLGFGRVVTKIEDPELEHICIELGLADTIIPSRHIAQTLAAMALEETPQDLSIFFKGAARLFSFVVREEEKGPVAKLGLPSGATVICLYRGGEFVIVEAKSEVAVDDEVVVLTNDKTLPKLKERWAGPKPGA